MKGMIAQRSSVALTLAVLMAVFLTACGGGGEDAGPSGDTAAPAAPAAPVFDEATAGSIQGVVNYADGEDPDRPIRMDADPVCKGLHSGAVYTETVMAEDGSLTNAFVYIKSGLEAYNFPVAEEPAVLRQEGCIYRPHVSGMMAGQTLKVINDDDTLHNVHATPTANPEFNAGQPFKGMELEQKFENTEIMVPFKCDVHPWMSSYVAVVAHPYFAVSGDDGSFAIDKLPPGDYTVEVWHETLGTRTRDVTVEANEAAQVEITYGNVG